MKKLLILSILALTSCATTQQSYQPYQSPALQQQPSHHYTGQPLYDEKPTSYSIHRDVYGDVQVTPY